MNNKLKKINVDLPSWVVTRLDKEAEAVGISRKAMINILLVKILGSKNSVIGDESDYSKMIENSIALEWLSKDDEEAFNDL